MRKDFYQELSPEVREKTKKNLVYVGIFSVIMLFAGFTSAYYVSMGDSFWLKYPLPNAFWWSTAAIVLSSIVIQLAIGAAKKNNQSRLKGLMAATLVLAAGFIYFQFRGYGQLTDFGAHAVNNHILVTDGRYGDYYEVKYKDAFIEIDGNNFLWKGNKMSTKQISEYQAFMKQFLEVDRMNTFKVSNYGESFILYYENQPVGLINGKLTKPDGKELEYVDRLRLRDLSLHVRDKRGDFFIRGEMGKDFHIYYKGEEVEYNERQLYFKGTKLSRYLQIKAMETADTATSYLYLITFLHVLHVIVAGIYLLRVAIRSFSGQFNSDNTLSLRMGAIFWHFLGVLWVYLLLFLLFIH
jgi:cytochrome c oxidase subunit 3